LGAARVAAGAGAKCRGGEGTGEGCDGVAGDFG
jgi:hypothetical protein